MKFAVFSRIAVCILGFGCCFPQTLPASESCKCPKKPQGPGGGVKCAKDQLATCDATSGECDCTCDSVPLGKSKDYYQAFIFSKALHTTVDPSELSSPEYRKFVSSFRNGDDKGTFVFDKGAGSGRPDKVEVGVPEWLDEVLSGKGGTSIGPGASLQACPNGTCKDIDNSSSVAGSINAGPCSIVQVGGSNNQATGGSCGPPEPNIKVSVAKTQKEGGDYQEKVTLRTDTEITSNIAFTLAFDGTVESAELSISTASQIGIAGSLATGVTSTHPNNIYRFSVQYPPALEKNGEIYVIVHSKQLLNLIGWKRGI